MKHRRFFEGHRPHPRQRPSDSVIIYQSELDYISRCILDYRNIETGGQLFGFWTSAGIPVVLYAIGPGERANHQSTFFNQDLDYLLKVGNHVLEKYGLQHIGEWHSHHQLGLAHPSGHDAATMVHNIARQHLGQFLLCIGNCDGSRSTLNAFNFSESCGYDYVQAGWSVKAGKSPFRDLVDSDLGGLLIHPVTSMPSHGDMRLVDGGEHLVTPQYASDYWLNDKSNNLVLKRILDFLKDAPGVYESKVQLDESRHVHIYLARNNGAAGQCLEHIYFPEGFPAAAPTITVSAEGSAISNAFAGSARAWNFSFDIFQAFVDYYRGAESAKAKEEDRDK